ncbi:MAG TPA: SDR family NAD(P)-dependent oxidoreductase [Gaiellales bacterium]|jgi:NAD(P)-dependent dehydrogenase (short-subunit alcohol dehydrogenase family)|nr:SDR family NAD(P)-dependent oxidoreductase [Gaiellales bacterium]
MSIEPGAVTARLFDVRGSRALVTGAASGLGLAVAEVLAECGARVTLADIHAERLVDEAGRLSAGGCEVRTAVVDVTDDASVRSAFADAAGTYGGLDVVFANAGIAAVPGYANAGGQELHSVGDEAWRRVLGVNLDGVLSTMRAAAGVMKPQRSGRIVVTASTAGLRADPMVCYGYAASKAAVINVAKQAALELAPHGVHVNVIAPGPIKTRIGGGVTPESEQQWAARVPLGRMGEPEELKGLALMLASPAASFITGAVITIDGGQLLGEPGGW